MNDIMFEFDLIHHRSNVPISSNNTQIFFQDLVIRTNNEFECFTQKNYDKQESPK